MILSVAQTVRARVVGSRLFTLGTLLLAGCGFLFGVTDSMTINNAAAASPNYPLQFARPFVEGEIPACPQVIFNGTPLTTQADVKVKWPDGSVKHAVIAVVLPSVPAGASTIAFQNQACGNTPLTQAQMLAGGYNFDAQIQASIGTTSARTMLTNGDYTLWTSGQVAQTIVLARDDNSATCNGHACSVYDFGADANKALRPRFLATFWPALNAVQVRYIVESANTETLEDQTYSVTLTAGNTSPATVYTHTPFTHTAMTRWTKKFWLGIKAPPPLGINHNVAYLASTTLLPNYDTTVTPSSARIASDYANWGSAGTDIYGAGLWTQYMPEAGSRPDIGPFPDWHILWVYSGDPREQTISLGSSDLAAAWPFHLREGKTGKILNRGDTGNTGLGHVLSIAGRPSFWNEDFTVGNSGDLVTPVGAYTNGGWTLDEAHCPNAVFVSYLLTGDYWYLEEEWFWAGWSIAVVPYYPGVNRGPSPGNYAVLNHGQLRATAWDLRNVVEAAAITPDAAPEKAYFQQSVADAIAAEEGVRNVTGTAYQGITVWNYGRTAMASNNGSIFPGSPFTLNGALPPLHAWWVGGGTAGNGPETYTQCEYGIACTTAAGTMSTSGATATFTNAADCAALSPGSVLESVNGSFLVQVVSRSCPTATLDDTYGIPPGTAFQYADVQLTMSLFEQDYMMYSLGRCVELGYACNALAAWLGQFYVNGLTATGFNPVLLTNGRLPTTLTSLNNGYISQWTQLENAYNVTWRGMVQSPSYGDPDGYQAYLRAAAAYAAGGASGAGSWSVMSGMLSGDASYATNPKWALVPRNNSGSTGQLSACDLNDDGIVDALDVQLAINEALGVAPCAANIEGSDVCNAVVVQRVVNAALGGTCRVGP